MNNHPLPAFLVQQEMRFHVVPMVYRARQNQRDCPKQLHHRSADTIIRPTVTALALFVLLLAMLLPHSVALASNSASPDISLNARAVIDSINQIRTSNGLPYLNLNPQLVQAAQTHVVDMVTNSHHSHTGTDGSSVRTRIERSGYGPGNRSGENWVALTDPTKAVDWWMASPPHRANILSSSWQEIGIGAGVNTNSGLNYFVVVFAAKSDGYVAPAPATSVASQAPAPSVLPESHRVQSGETLSAIALRYGLTWQSIAQMNSLGEYSILTIGQSLRLPSNGVVAQPSRTTQIRNMPYTVVAGDTLFSLGGRFNIPWQKIAQHNGLAENSVLSIEQVLQIPMVVETINEAILEERTFIPPSITPEFHIVQNGETIILIALQYDLNWKQLLSMNSLTDATLLAVGQQIRLK